MKIQFHRVEAFVESTPSRDHRFSKLDNLPEWGREALMSRVRHSREALMSRVRHLREALMSCVRRLRKRLIIDIRVMHKNNDFCMKIDAFPGKSPPFDCTSLKQFSSSIIPRMIERKTFNEGNWVCFFFKPGILCFLLGGFEWFC